MTEADFSVEVSVARKSDYKAVSRLCRRAVGSNDYALRILDEVITDRGLFLAWVGEQLVGMTRFDECIDGSAWLSMARTDPDWQGLGIARALQRELAKRGEERGINTLRLWTLSANRAAIRACERGGFHRVCEVMHVSHEFRSRTRNKNSHLTSDLAFTRRTLGSRYLSKTGGYFAYKWQFVRASVALIEKISRKHELYSDKDLTFVLTKPERSFHRLSCSFSLLEGDPVRSMRLILMKARNLGAVWVGGYLPYDRRLLAAALKCDLRVDSWGNHCYIFEKTI